MAGKDGRRMAARAAGQAKSAAAEAQFTATLAGLEVALRATARRHPDFAARLRERDLVAQIRLAGGAAGAPIPSAAARCVRAPGCTRRRTSP